jgi:GT2 family glycosyltransferase
VPVPPDVTPSVTVVICAYTEKRWPQIVRSVDSVRHQRVPAAQIVVVIDHDDALLDRAAAAFPELTVVPNAGPRGLSGARNTGVARARGTIVAFLDDDAQAEPDWLARLLPHYRDPVVVAVGGHATPVWQRGRPRWLPPEFDWVIGCSYTGQPSKASPVRNLIGCNMSFRRAVLDRIDGFDPTLGRVEGIPAGCEETELCIRIQQTYPGSVVLYEPAARVRHLMTEDRATWGYFRRRCYSEGRSKAVVARLVGSRAGLAAERAYTLRTLPSGFVRGLREIRDDRAGLLRAAAILAGLLATTCGYVSAHTPRAGRGRPAPAGAHRAGGPAPASAHRAGGPAPASAHRAGGPAPASAHRAGGPAPTRVVAVELSEGVPEVPDDGPGGCRYGAARVLVRLHGQPLGLLDIDLPPGGLAAEAHARVIAGQLSKEIDRHLRADGLPPLGWLTAEPVGAGTCCPPRTPTQAPPLVSVVIPTCGRTAMLGRLLDSLTAVDYPHYEVIVVDNAPHPAATSPLVAGRAARDQRIRYVREPRAGVQHARNRGLAEAAGEIVAFTDDDVIVDRQWLPALAGGFAEPDVAAVTGHVLAHELETPAQVLIEQYGGFGKGCARRRYHRTGVETVEQGEVRRVPATRRSLYPYLPGTYGSGANMAFRTDVARRMGGFDPLLRAGEDIDMLMRLVLRGHTLLYEPAAIVWHTHRRDMPALRRAVYGYGVGLSAVMVKCLAASANDGGDLLRRLPRGIAYALHPRSAKNSRKQHGYPRALTALELLGMAVGPAHYAMAAWSARRGRKRA